MFKNIKVSIKIVKYFWKALWNPVVDEVLHEVFDFKAYLALEPTEEYKKNQNRIKREQDEAKGIFTILSKSEEIGETEETKTNE